MIGPETFKRLPAKRRGFIRRASIWDAGEYLLSVSGTTFAERYRRFYYRDIKAIVVQQGPRLGSIGSLVSLAFVAFIFGIVAFSNPYRPKLVHLLWIAPLAWLAIILYQNLARSCRVFVYTAVSSEELPAILRRSAASRVVPELINKVHAAQGEFVPSEVRDTLPAENVTAAALPVSTTPQEVAASPQALYGSVSFFTVLLTSAAFAFWYRNTLLTPASLLTAKTLFCILNGIGVITGVWALLRLFSVRLFASLRVAVFCGLGLMALRTYSLYFTMLQIKVERGAVIETMGIVRWRQWLGTGDCAVSLLIGIAGLILLIYAWQNEIPDPKAVSPVPDTVTGDSISSL